ncbi:MAG: hypothetical protein JWM23_588 [Microbacteriaceae bacterium]|nr:hypothetical protein [Microbacteriaceae bacterium]
MSAVEEIQAAIEKLTRIKGDAGLVTQGADQQEVFFRTDDDTDGDGNFFSFGLGIDLGESELVQGVVTLHRTIDPLLGVLRESLAWERKVVSYRQPSQSDERMVTLARAINGATS